MRRMSPRNTTVEIFGWTTSMGAGSPSLGMPSARLSTAPPMTADGPRRRTARSVSMRRATRKFSGKPSCETAAGAQNIERARLMTRAGPCLEIDVRQAFQPDSDVGASVAKGGQPVRAALRYIEVATKKAERTGLQPALADESIARSAWKG